MIRFVRLSVPLDFISPIVGLYDLETPLILFLPLLIWQMIMLEGAKATTETVDALRNGASAMKAMQKAT